jgi:hypothetical protein
LVKMWTFEVEVGIHSVVECLSGLWEALGSIPSTAKF